jgi:uncharacterized protein (TIGR04141 family)
MKPDRVALANVLRSPGDLHHAAIDLGGGMRADLYVQRSIERRPNWTDLFAAVLDLRDTHVANESSAAVLLVECGQDRFAITFGHGRHLLQPSSYEETFGLRVVLNAVDPNRLKTIDRERLSEQGRRSRDQVTRDSQIAAFGIDVEQDMLRSVTGRPRDAELGVLLSGSDSLTAKMPVELRDVPAKLALFAAKSRELTYRERFAFVDHVREIKDRDEIQSLGLELTRRLQRRELEELWLTAPQIVDWSRVEFRYSSARQAPRYADLHVSDLLDAVRRPEDLNADRLKTLHIVAIDVASDSVVERWPVWRCLYAQFAHAGAEAILTNGRWYRVDSDFAKEVDREIELLPETSIALLPGKAGEDESSYNKRVAQSDPDRFVLMDAVSIRHGGGQSQIEFCDIYARDKVMIHVKRYGAASVLSHLFAQGSNSGTLFAQDALFRQRLNEKLPASHQLVSPGEHPDVREFEVAFAVISRSRKPLRLPFFSRLSLRNATRLLQGYGYRVSCTKVPLEAIGKKELAA